MISVGYLIVIAISIVNGISGAVVALKTIDEDGKLEKYIKTYR